MIGPILESVHSINSSPTTSNYLMFQVFASLESFLLFIAWQRVTVWIWLGILTFWEISGWEGEGRGRCGQNILVMLMGDPFVSVIFEWSNITRISTASELSN